MGRIVVLPAAVQGQIAAGEVVERPASIVKELLENAIDAGARHVDVVLEDGGLGGITVRDDGVGMSAEEAELAFARHATSKLRSAEDLEAIGTFGFRGEALPSIAAAARVVLRTRTADAPAGTTIEASLDGVRQAGPVGMPAGTVVEVRDLFGRAPARRKFLRQPATELGHAADVVTRLAVAHPDIGMRLTHDRRVALELPPAPDPYARLVQVLGRARAEGLAPISGTLGDVDVHGYVGSPRDSLGSPRLVWTYVSLAPAGATGAPRWIRDRVLLRAVLDGYDTFLMRGRYPICVVMVRLPPGSIDVNVHPAKLEVRFRDTRPVHRVVSETIRRALTQRLATSAGELQRGTLWAGAPDGSGAVREAAAANAPATAPAPGGERDPTEAAFVQPGLWGAAPEGFTRTRFVAQVFDGYLLCDAGDRLVVVDQHAAHERVIFDRLIAGAANEPVERAMLLVPEAISVARGELAQLAAHGDLLAQAGLEGEPFGDETFLLRSVPAALRGHDAGEVVRAVAAELASDGASRAAERALERVLATVACHAATRVGQRLAPAEATALLAQMDEATVNAHCPHGRPVAIQLRRARIEALFGR